MEIRFLGAHNTEAAPFKSVSLLLDDKLALDAGAITAVLSLKEQLNLEALLLTHAHYDHIKDVPALAMNFFLSEQCLSLYATKETKEALNGSLLNGRLYPDFFAKPADAPTLEYGFVETGREMAVAGYSVVPLAVKHSLPAVGYAVRDKVGKTLFYSGDTGLGLEKCWDNIKPDALVIDVTAPERYRRFALESGHLTAGLLKEELEAFRRLKGYLPSVYCVHMNPLLEDEIAAELKGVAQELEVKITPAAEGMALKI